MSIIIAIINVYNEKMINMLVHFATIYLREVILLSAILQPK